MWVTAVCSSSSVRRGGSPNLPSRLGSVDRHLQVLRSLRQSPVSTDPANKCWEVCSMKSAWERLSTDRLAMALESHALMAKSVPSEMFLEEIGEMLDVLRERHP